MVTASSLSDETLIKQLLVCPACHGPLDWASEAVTCTACAASYAVVDGIPIFLADPKEADHDELDHHEHHDHHDHDEGKARSERQLDYYDHEIQEEFEISRPHGT